jgi:hypothetical protein
MGLKTLPSHRDDNKSVGTIDKHGLAARDQRLFRLLLPSQNAAVIDGLAGIVGPAVTTLSLRRGNA